MKIAYDHQIFGWQRFGGISRYFFELANRLAKMREGRDQVQIVSPLHVNEYLAQAQPPLRIMGRHAPAIRRTGRIYRTLNSVLAPMALRDYAPDLVHETYYSNRTMAPSRSKVVLTVFDMIHEIFPQHFASWDRTRFEKQMAVKRADHIICISENTRQDLVRELGVRPEKTTVVHLGFSLTLGASAPPPNRRPFLLFVGSRSGYKNFETLLRAYGSTPGLRGSHDLVAFGGGGFSQEERALMRQFGFDEQQVRQQAGDDGMLAALYKQAALFVYPSLYEGFGIPPLEAMSFDCPVACSNTSSIPEVVGSAAVLFDPKSIESIARALESILGDDKLRATLISRGRERVELFSWERCAQQTFDVYRKVLT